MQCNVVEVTPRLLVGHYETVILSVWTHISKSELKVAVDQGKHASKPTSAQFCRAEIF